ncbi:MAG: family 43 glycosylhydrolase [Bacteroides graminisolvens]|nr:family 43 glycosylhydrolase [Bacteroides graminisolvens]
MLVSRKAILPFLFACCNSLFAQNIQNPVLTRVADAGVMKYNGKYYLGGVRTNGDFYVSEDLAHWSKPIHVVSMNNDWSQNTGADNSQIHANDMLYLNGQFHLYWSVNYWGKDKHAVHIVHAQSQHVLGPYVEPDKKSWMDNRIDPKLFKDDDGQLYMYMVRFTDGNTIWARKMKNPSQFAGDPVCLFASLPNTWETIDNRVAEGPWVIKYRQRYYMMYNANHTSTHWGNYQLGVAEADSPLSFQNGNKYSYPVVESNQSILEENYVDVLRYDGKYNPFFAYTETKPLGGWTLPVYKDSDWKQGEGGFAAEEIAGSTTRKFGTKWDSSFLWLRKNFTAQQTRNLALRVLHTGDTKVYLNGLLIYEKGGSNYCIVNLEPKQCAILKEGNNLLAIETQRGHSPFFDVSLFDMRNDKADDILMTPGQPNILRGPNGFEWWLVYMANKNNDQRGQYINRVQFFDKTMYVDGITGPQTAGYHPTPSLPTFSMNMETTSFGVLKQLKPSNAYLFETAIKTTRNAGVVAWWQDENHYARVGLDAGSQCWYLQTCMGGSKSTQTFPLPTDFRWGVYHHFRVERNMGILKVWLDEIPTPQKHLFSDIIPALTPGVPGVFDESGNATFEGVTYTIGFDDEEVALPAEREILKGELLCQYELSFQLSGLSEQSVSGSYPIYVDKDNYVKAFFNGSTRMFEVTAVKKGQSLWHKKYSLSCIQTVYPDVKYTDFIEKNYRFSSPCLIDTLYLNRHDADHKSTFVDDMFSLFTIEYLQEGKWLPIKNQLVEIAAHPAFNRLSVEPVKAEGIRFTNKNAEDIQRHIYKLRVHQQFKDSYNFRAVRRNDKLYLFVDGKEIDEIEIQYPASRIGLCTGKTPVTYNGILYYHIEK